MKDEKRREEKCNTAVDSRKKEPVCILGAEEMMEGQSDFSLRTCVSCP